MKILQVLEDLIARGVDPHRIILGNGSANVPDTKELIQAALRNRCLAVLLAPPSYYKNVSEAGVIAYFRTLIEQVNPSALRVLLYHIPQNTSASITVKIAKTLHDEFPGIVVGIKESEGNDSLTQNLLVQIPNFQVFVGKEDRIIKAVHNGVAGTICGIANLYPELICSLGKVQKDTIAENPIALTRLLDALKRLPFISAAKAVMEQREGEGWNTLRPPLTPLDSNQKKLFLLAIRELE